MEGPVPLELLVCRDLMETEVHRDLVDSRDFAASRARREHRVMLPLIKYRSVLSLNIIHDDQHIAAYSC